MRIAIVGAGVSGLVAAHLLHREHQITLYEAAAYAGGHTNTVRVDTERHTYHVDTGFIVMNDRTYPNFSRLLEQLGVLTQPTHMSFSVKSEDEDFEYAGTPRGLFAQPRNLLSPKFLRMIAELLRFNRELRTLLRREETGQSLDAFLAERGFSDTFVRKLIVPQVSAVWSADPHQSTSFPVRFMAEFFANHGMLGFRDRPNWSTVTGGSARYVEALTRPFHDRIRLRQPVHSVTRAGSHVEIRTASGEPEHYDHVVMATHSDQALALLSDPSQRESRVLDAIRYQRNEAVLHTDSTLLPRRRAARAAWNYHLLREPKPLSTVTYYMNHLQALQADRDFCVTLNRTEAIDPSKIIRKLSYAHPVYTPRALAAQSQHAAISGLATRTHYCGAYWGWGFHEDGVRSALQACAAFGVKL
ncbi:MAG TPA: FAD-dependent oxidoreductase [Solirubrobacteraceae bacterium]|nr:FAD-dependent oxidoreductase [Solirubrobacteraceae bacterium]